MKKYKVDISIVILNYNSISFLRDCIKSIEGSNLKGVKVETIVVDNASTDDSVSVIRKKYPRLTLIASKKNTGFAGGNNLARRVARGEYILFLNPDTILGKNVLYEVYKFMEAHEEVGAATCKLELANGDIDYSCHRGFPTPANAFFYFTGISKLFPKSRLFSGYIMGWELDNPENHEIDALTGAFLFVRRVAADKVGWWDEDYFWYGEDLEFSYRLKEKGWKIMYLPKLKTLHYKGVTSGIKKHTKAISSATKETRIRSSRASTQAMRIFFKKHYSDKYPKVVLNFVLLGITLLQKYRELRA